MNERVTCSGLLQEINTEIKHSNTRHLLIFDLDDTLFDTFYRRIFIYDVFLRDQFTLPRLSFSSHKNFYNFINILEKSAHIKDKLPELSRTYRYLFLSNWFLHLDKLFNGVLQFFKHLFNFDIQIAFLTGRCELDMKLGTYGCLYRYNLINPLRPVNNVFMKKSPNLLDSSFKYNELKLIQNMNPDKKIIIFDNESKNCRIFNEILPKDSKIIRFNSVQKQNCQFDGYILENWH